MNLEFKQKDIIELSNMSLESKRKRIIDISKKLKRSHVGSCLSVLPLLNEVYMLKHEDDKVFLSGAHSHLAHLMFTQWFNAERFIQMDTHCNLKVGCDFPGGSLGHLGIAVGYALANPSLKVWCILTDGSVHEGSEMEALRFIEDAKIPNIKVLVNANGFTATREIDRDRLSKILRALYSKIDIRYTNNDLDELQGVNGHYAILEEVKN